jgi:tetratricopeptide (TPR) repeat protein
MKSRIALLIAIILAMVLAGCSRELKQGGEEPWQPFPFDSIPQFAGQQQGQRSTGETEPVRQAEIPQAETPESAEGENPVVAGLLDSGREALQAGNLDLAVDYFMQVLDKDENNTAALYNLGYIYRRAGDADRAVEYASRAVESAPNRLYVHQNLGLAYEEQGNIDAAITEYEQELINHPNEPSLAGIAEKLALIYLDRGLYQEAFDAANRAVNMNPDEPEYHATLAKVHMANGAYDRAVTVLEEAVVLEPDKGEYRKLLGDALWEAGRQDEAGNAYEAAITLDPDLADEIDPERLPAADEDSGIEDPAL